MAPNRKLLRTIRLDASDTFVFPRAADPGEWAIPGTFLFWDQDLSAIAGREKQAFRSGFLGLASFGWSTLAVVSEVTDDERAEAVLSLARYLVDVAGAPDLAAAEAAAEEEFAYAEDLAQHPVQTLVALHRKLSDDGNISEQFRTFRAADAKKATAMPCSAGAFAVVDDDGAPHDHAGEPAEAIDLAGLVAGRQPTQSRE